MNKLDDTFQFRLNPEVSATVSSKLQWEEELPPSLKTQWLKYWDGLWLIKELLLIS